MQRGTATDYYEQDGVGSVTSLTASNGSVAQSYTYDSFGNTTNSSGSLTNFFRYTAREFDTETGLYFYRARYYDPGAGRFLSEDPLRFRAGIVARSVLPSVDFYTFVMNDPVVQVDPTGLWQAEIGGGYGGGVLVTFGYNNGQWNFGFYGGFGIGGFVSFDPSPSGCHSPGFVGGLRGEGDVGVEKGGFGLSASSEIDVNGEGSSSITGYSPAGSVTWDPSKPTEPPHGALGGGAGGFLGAGGTSYFPSSACGCR